MIGVDDRSQTLASVVLGADRQACNLRILRREAAAKIFKSCSEFRR